MKEAIFLSYATPEDNNIARWLGVKPVTRFGTTSNGSRVGLLLGKIEAATNKNDLPPLPFQYYS